MPCMNGKREKGSKTMSHIKGENDKSAVKHALYGWETKKGNGQPVMSNLENVGFEQMACDRSRDHITWIM